MKHLAWVVAVAALGLVAWRGSGMGAAEEAAPPAGDGVFATIAPFNSYGHVHDADNVEAMRPRVMGTHGVISSGHYLATQAGYDVLKAGGQPSTPASRRGWRSRRSRWTTRAGPGSRRSSSTAQPRTA